MVTSISKIKLFKACRKAYEFRYIEKLVPVEKADALEIGSNYHSLLEKMYSGDDSWDDPSDFSKEHAMACAYHKHIFPEFSVKLVEGWFSKPVGKHLLQGRVDGLASDGLLVEHKTTSAEITEEYEYSLLWDEQILAYMYLTGTRSVYYTICRKPNIRQKKGELDEEFFYRMVMWYEVDLPKKLRVLRISRTDEEVDAFVKEFATVCDEMDRGVIYRNPGYCTRWGRQCEYANVCLNYDPSQNYVGFVKEDEDER